MVGMLFQRLLVLRVFFAFLGFCAFLGFSLESYASLLVSKETIDRQKELTSILMLDNGTKVVYRKIDNSEISSLSLSYPFGIAHMENQQKAAAKMMMTLMPKAAKGYPKKKVYALTEKFSSSVGCTYGIEVSACSLSTVNDYFDNLLPLFTAITRDPSYHKEDLKLQKASRIAQLEGLIEEPDSYVNQVVNRHFYPDDHPYKLSFEDEIVSIKRISTKDLKKLHKTLKHSKGQFFTYVGSLDKELLKKKLNKMFGDLVLKPVKTLNVKEPVFTKEKSLSLEDRNIPTAYMSLKFNGPGRQHKDYLATVFMLHILSEELGLEIRTNRSLSYAVHSYMIGHSIGINVISATTSKPRETLEAIDSIIAAMKKKTYSQEEMKRYKNVYTTSYFLTLEEHASLSATLATNFHYYKTLDKFYERPLRLASIDGKMVREMAKKYLVDFRIGVIFNKKNFKENWAHALISHHRS